MKLSASVGENGVNVRSDVRAVQILLNHTSAPSVPRLPTDGVCGATTRSAIKAFQANQVHIAHPDGLITSNSLTLQTLNAMSHHRLRARHIPIILRSTAPVSDDDVDPTLPVATAGSVINAEKFTQMAQKIGCEVAAIKAVAMTETLSCPFDSQGRPVILFERHLFHQLTYGRFDTTHPDISDKMRGGYGKKGSSYQYKRLEDALKCDRQAALQSASWGAFQLMGKNFKIAGCSSVEDFVQNMADMNKQADMFVNFICNQSPLRASIVSKHWTRFARLYNGPDYAFNDYDGKLHKNYLIALKA